MFEVNVRIANPARAEFHERKMLVDTGASYSALPASFLRDDLGIEPLGEEPIYFADNSSHMYSVGEARFRVDVNGNRLVKCSGFLVSIRGEPYRSSFTIGVA